MSQPRLGLLDQKKARRLKTEKLSEKGSDPLPSRVRTHQIEANYPQNQGGLPPFRTASEKASGELPQVPQPARPGWLRTYWPVIAGGGKFRALAHNKFADDKSRTNASPIVHDGCLLMRTDQYLYCIGDKR